MELIVKLFRNVPVKDEWTKIWGECRGERGELMERRVVGRSVICETEIAGGRGNCSRGVVVPDSLRSNVPV